MQPFILVKIDYGKNGIEYADTQGESRKEIAANLAHGGYDCILSNGLGLVQVIEVNPDNTWTDITADICKLAEHYIAANCMVCDRTVLRLLTEHGAVEPQVAAIVNGNCVAAEREPDRALVAA